MFIKAKLHESSKIYPMLLLPVLHCTTCVKYIKNISMMNGIHTVTTTPWTLKFVHPVQVKAVQLMHQLKP